jgi:UDP-glucose 4-epimerase
MHFAAYALVPESMEKPELYFGNNLLGGINLAEAMLRAEVGSIVFSSTCATYGEPEAVPITEEEKQRPTNPYGESKLAFERVLEWSVRLQGMRAVFLRYFNACGATRTHGEDHDPETHLIPRLCRHLMGELPGFSVFGTDHPTPDGTAVRDYVHVTDLAHAHALALESIEAGRSDAINLGTGNGASVRQILDTAAEVTGVVPDATDAPRREGDPPRLVASNDRAKERLGWSPENSALQEIIRSAWEWHRAHPRGYDD